MSKQPTINDQLNELAVLITDECWPEAVALATSLSKRRLTKAQAESLEIHEAEIADLAPEIGYTMSNQLKKYRGNYVVSVAGSGAKSLSNGDDLAKFLELKTPEQVCKLADEVCGAVPGFHEAKYERLNPGQQRMNAGNKIRARWKKGEWSIPA